MFVEVSKKEKALGGRLTADQKHVIVASIEDGFTIIEKIEAELDNIGELIDKGADVFHKIKHFFEDLLNRLPTKIKQNGKTYRLNELPAPGAAEDVVLYRCEENANDILFQTTGRNRTKARSAMFDLLNEESFIF